MKYVDAVLKEGMSPPPSYPSTKSTKSKSCDKVLRLYPPVPINSRTTNRATVLPTGGGVNGNAPILVRKGEAVGFCPYIMHRHPDIFGADSQKFRPERWLENEGKLFSAAGYGYVPFSAGPRSCIGRNLAGVHVHRCAFVADDAYVETFAMREATFAVASIVRKFESVRVPEGEDVEDVGDERQKLTLVLCCADGCKVVFS